MIMGDFRLAHRGADNRLQTLSHERVAASGYDFGFDSAFHFSTFRLVALAH